MFQVKRQVNRKRLIAVFALYGAAALIPALMVQAEDGKKDILYIGDAGDDSIKRFDAKSGAFLDGQKGSLVSPGSMGLHGPRGIIIDKSHGIDDLIVVNQNVNQPFAGEVLSYTALDGQFLRAIVPCNPEHPRDPTDPFTGPFRSCDPKAPFSPDGILRLGNELLVADQSSDYVSNGGDYVSNFPEPNPLSGRVARYDAASGKWLGDLNYSGFAESCAGLTCRRFSARGIVLGPDDALYVSAMQLMPNTDVKTLSGNVIRFGHHGSDPGTVFVDGDKCNNCGLARPDALVFGPNGKLYVTSFRKLPVDDSPIADNDKILVFNADGSYADKIDLDEVPKPPPAPIPARACAQAILFGPGGKLFVPISCNGPDTGSLRRYNVRTKAYDVFIPSSANGGAAIVPWYLSFGETDSATLSYGH